MTGRRLTELINLSSNNTRHAGFTDDAVLVMWCVIGCLHQWFLLVNGIGLRLLREKTNRFYSYGFHVKISTLRNYPYGFTLPTLPTLRKGGNQA